MVCTFCGAPSSEGAMVCNACSAKVTSEIYLRDWAVDPRSDLRSLGMRSACLRIGPSSQGEVLLGKGPDPYLLVQRTAHAEDRSHLPAIIDMYLSGMGMGLHLMGDEQLPERPVLKELLSLPEMIDLEGEKWGRVLLRLGNVLAIGARDVSRLPLGDEGRKEAFVQRASQALSLYQRAGKVAELEPMARANIAMLRHFGGGHEAALEELRTLVPSSDGIRLQLARTLMDLGLEDEATDVVAQTADMEASIIRLRRGCQ